MRSLTTDLTVYAKSSSSSNMNCIITNMLSYLVHYRDWQKWQQHCTDRLNASNAIRGAYGMLHFDTADWNGQKPVVRTRTKRSTPFRLAYSKNNYMSTLGHSLLTYVSLSHMGNKKSIHVQYAIVILEQSLFSGSGNGLSCGPPTLY